MLCRAAIVFYPDQSEGRAVKIWFHKLRNYFRIRSIISPEINEERTMNYVVLKYTDVPLVHLSFFNIMMITVIIRREQTEERSFVSQGIPV